MLSSSGVVRSDIGSSFGGLSGTADGVPLMVTEAWVPEHVGRHVTAAALKKRALFEILMAEGVKFGRVVQEVTAVAADPHYAGLLQTDVATPLLRMTRLLYDTADQPIQHLTIHVSSQRSRILMDVPADAINTLSAGHITHDLLPEPPVRRARGTGAKG